MFENKQEDFYDVINSVDFYLEQAEKAAVGKAWLASCIMIGAALEAVLKALCMAYKEGKVIQDTYILSMSLSETIKLLHYSGWLPKSKRKAGNLAEEIITIRNLIHVNKLIKNTSQNYELKYELLYGYFDLIRKHLVKVM